MLTTNNPALAIWNKLGGWFCKIMFGDLVPPTPLCTYVQLLLGDFQSLLIDNIVVVVVVVVVVRLFAVLYQLQNLHMYDLKQYYMEIHIIKIKSYAEKFNTC